MATTDQEKDVLCKASLEEKVSELPEGREEFRSILIQEFLKLEDSGGFELCKCLPNTRKLVVLADMAHNFPALLGWISKIVQRSPSARSKHGQSIWLQ